MSTSALRTSGFLGPEFNAFLFEPIGLDEAGRPLSVVSALARLDLDAWAEAARLARMPKHLAADTLANLIRKFTEYPLAVRDSHKIAVRLVGLLPRGTQAGGQTAAAAAPGSVQHPWRTAAVFIILMALVLGLYVIKPRMHSPAQGDAVPPQGTSQQQTQQ